MNKLLSSSCHKPILTCTYEHPQVNAELDKRVKLPENLWVLVLHVSLQVEFLKLGEPAEAEQADDLAAQVVAEVPLGPGPLECAAVVDPGRHPLQS